MSEKDIRKNCLPSVEDVEKENEEAHRQDLIRRYWKHKKEAEIIDLQLHLMDIMTSLRPKYLPGQSNDVQKAENENRSELLMIFRAYTDNTCQPTSYTYKFFYLLTVAFLGFITNWLNRRPPYLVTTSLLSFLFGTFPLKNIINLCGPTKSICDKLKLIESFIWKKKHVYDEDFIKMKALRNYAFFLAYLSPPLCFIVNLALFFGTLSGTIRLYNYLYPFKKLSEPLSMFWSEFGIFLITFSYLLGYLLKFICFRWMFQKHLSPKIIRWFF